MPWNGRAELILVPGDRIQRPHGPTSHGSPAGSARPRRPQSRRRHDRRRAAASASARRATRRQARPSRTAVARRPRSRAGAPAGRPRCCGGSARCAGCSGNFSSAGSRRRRRAWKPLCWSAPRRSCGSTFPTTPPSISRSGSCRPIAAAATYAGLVNAVLRRVAQHGPARLADARQRGARHAGLADGALAASLRRGHRARHRRRQRSRAAARFDRQARSPNPGPHACADDCCRPAPCARQPRARCRCCPVMSKAPGGCRTRPRRCRSACSATCTISPSRICAPRPAARRRSSRSPARASPRSIARTCG